MTTQGVYTSSTQKEAPTRGRVSAQSLYTGKRTIGDVLQKMWRDGRQEVDRQRSRWQTNRAMYRGDQYLDVSGGRVRRLAPTDRLPTGRHRDTVNRLRQFTDGRVSLLTHQTPPFMVVPASQDQQSIDAARFSEKFVRAQWSDPWDLDTFRVDLCLAGEQDGVSFACVLFDPTAKEPVTIGIVTDPPDPEAGTPGGPRLVTDREEIEALQDQDPDGEVLWRKITAPMGEVVFRVVRAGFLSIDPMMCERWDDARWVIESRIRPVEDVEAETGKTFQQIMDASHSVMGTSAPYQGDKAYPVLMDGGDGNQRMIGEGEAVLCHTLFHKAGGLFPKGAHIRWLDQAPGAPYFAEEWGDVLPYYPYRPKPDGGHIVHARGTVDELSPIQVMLNRRVSQIGEWMDLVARPPVITVGGALKSPYIFNEKRIIELTPGFSPPAFLHVPGEPATILTTHIQWLIEQMAEVAIQSAAVRGTPPGQGVEAAVGINLLIQQTEQQLSGTERQLVGAIEWSVTRALRLVEKNYILPRLVSAPGVDDTEELRAFTGDTLGGATQVRVTGSILPRSRAAQLQTLFQLTQMTGGRFDITPWVPQIVEGSTEEFISDQRADENRAARENRRIGALGRHPDRDRIWTAYQEMQQGYQQALQVASQGPPQFPAGVMRVPGLPGSSPPPIPPHELLAQQGLVPPSLTPLVGDIGVEVEEYDVDADHMRTHDLWRKSDGFDMVHPIVKEYAKEHAGAHLAKMSKNIQAMGEQSAPIQPGAPPGGGPSSAGPPPGEEPKPPGGQAGPGAQMTNRERRATAPAGQGGM